MALMSAVPTPTCPCSDLTLPNCAQPLLKHRYQWVTVSPNQGQMQQMLEKKGKSLTPCAQKEPGGARRLGCCLGASLLAGELLFGVLGVSVGWGSWAG